jgi:hypothetical protein
MRKVLALVVLAMIPLAATPGPSPIITLDGVSAAAKLSPELRTAVAPRVKALNAMLEKVAAARANAPKAKAERATHTHGALDAHHDEFSNAIREITKQLDPEQRAAFYEYLHAQLKAAGIEVPDHGPGDHPRHGEIHGDADVQADRR